MRIFQRLIEGQLEGVSCDPAALGLHRGLDAQRAGARMQPALLRGAEGHHRLVELTTMAEAPSAFFSGERWITSRGWRTTLGGALASPAGPKERPAMTPPGSCSRAIRVRRAREAQQKKSCNNGKRGVEAAPHRISWPRHEWATHRTEERPESSAGTLREEAYGAS